MEQYFELKEESYGPFLPFVQDSLVTDINYNGQDTWIDHLEQGRYKAAVTVTPEFINQFSARIANAVSAGFNKSDNLLEAETDKLRISMIHESVANTGRSISIRKTEAIRRLTEGLIEETGYCSKELLMFLKNCIAAHLNVIMCGLPGSGKTELLKYLTQFIPDNERVITIEDNLEIHYSELNREKDCVELKVNETFFDYTKAIKACLRQNPKWIMLSEARSSEVKYLLEAMSTGTHCLTTLHTDDVRKVPDRMQNMVKDAMEAIRIENDIYSFVDVGVLLRKKVNAQGVIRRYVDQVCLYYRNETEKTNHIHVIAEDGAIRNRTIPEAVQKKFLQEEILDAFSVKGGTEP